MRVLCFYILFFMFSGFIGLYGQSEKKLYVYNDVANIRGGAGVDFEKIDEIYCGNEITVLEETEVESEIKGHHAKWIKIKYPKEGKDKEGYIWEGNLSLSQLRRGNVKFMYGIDSFDADKHEYYGTIKAVNEYGVIDQKRFISNATRGQAWGRIMDRFNLKNVKNIIVLDFFLQACGERANEIYFAWSGEKLNYILTCCSTSDAGAYYDLEALRLPDEGDFSNILIKLNCVGEMENEGDEDYKKSYSTELYEWDGEKATIIKNEI